MADQSGKPEEEGEHDGSLPEVEAELVRETPQAEGAFDADAPEGAAQADMGSRQDEAAAQDAPVKKTGGSPGVLLFGGFVVVALAAFAVWRFTPIGGPKAPAAELAASEDAAPAAQASPDISSPPERKPDLTADAPTPAPPDDEAEEKIANAPAGKWKTAPADEERDAGFLPPVTDERTAKIANLEDESAEEPAPVKDEPEAPPDETVASDEPPVQVVEADNSEDAEEPAAELEETEEDARLAEASAEQNASAAAAAEENRRLEAELAQLRADYDGEKRNLEIALQDRQRENDSLNAEIERLRAELQDAQDARKLAASEASEETASLREEINALRREQANTSSRQMRASFALAALSRAIDQGDPYTEELEAVAEFEPEAAAALELHAQEGVATEAALRIGFDAAAREALAAAGQENAGGGVAGLMARAKSLITVRPSKPMAGDAPGAVLSRAEEALEEGDVSYALLELEDLPVSAQEAMAGWMEEARARAEAEAALHRLQTEINGETG